MRWRIDFGDRPWHSWFAWYPVQFNGTDDRVWLERVERKIDNCRGWLIARYRPLSK